MEFQGLSQDQGRLSNLTDLDQCNRNCSLDRLEGVRMKQGWYKIIIAFHSHTYFQFRFDQFVRISACGNWSMHKLPILISNGVTKLLPSPIGSWTSLLCFNISSNGRTKSLPSYSALVRGQVCCISTWNETHRIFVFLNWFVDRLD